MKPIAPEDRRVANIHEAPFTPFLTEEGASDGDVLQVNGGRAGYGFHVYRMAPGQTTIAMSMSGTRNFC